MKMTWMVGLVAWWTVAAQGAEVQVFFGNLHSHTSFSDGSGKPDDAFKAARKAGLHFLAVTEHNHKDAERGLKGNDPRKDGILIAKTPALYNGAQSDSLISAARRRTVTWQFVAIYGQEFSTITSGNHANVFEVPEVIEEASVANGDFKALVAWLGTHSDSQGQPTVVQFNHPSKESRDEGEEYGMHDFGGEAKWKQEMGRHARLIEILNGPGTLQQPDLKPEVFESDYLHYLNLGFKLGPSGNQDNHWKNWGSMTDTRTGVIAESLTKGNILQALRQRHVYATSDKNLHIVFFVQGRLCGDVIETLPASNAELRIEHFLVDKDEPDAAYRIEVYSDRVGGGAAKVVERVRTDGNNTLQQLKRIEDVPFLGERQYVFFKVIQLDEHGEHGRAWTAPVWFERPVAPGAPPVTPLVAAPAAADAGLVASKNSQMYHVSAECRLAKAIKDGNRVTGAEARNGRAVYAGCPLE